jgi:hypothetical protein
MADHLEPRWAWSLAAFGLVAVSAFAQEPAASWYPLEPGDSWVYQKESLDGQMAHPDLERWTTEETIVSRVAAPDLGATLVTTRIKVLSDQYTAQFIPENDRAKRELPESHALIYQNCVYVLDGNDAQGALCGRRAGACLRPNRDDLVGGKIPPDYCFPMAIGSTWGRVSNTSPAGEYVWDVLGINSDPFGAPGGTTFHLSAHQSSGTQMDRWFEEGVGLLQEVIEHHGTYDEDRRQLLRATIRGKTQDYQLTPARTIPLSDWDCKGPGWQHFVHPNGAAFRDQADCIRYTANRR